jgi:hypothetical protein
VMRQTMADDKLRWGIGGGARFPAVRLPSQAAAESVVAERSWILNYVIVLVRNRNCIWPFCVVR